MIPLDSTFHLVAALLAVATLVAAAAVRLRQPLVIAFIAVGVLVGPSSMGWVQAHDEVAFLAELGIAVLLFLVGLKLDVHLIRSTGTVAVVAGVAQIALTVGLGLLLSLALGVELTAAAYVATALAFSSTIIVVKLLSDRREIDQLHGRVAVGILIVQDIVAIAVMIAISAYGGNEAGSVGGTVLLVAAKGVAFVGAITLLSRFVLPATLHWLAGSKDLLLLFAVAWAVSLAAVGDWLGFSKEVGAFLGGVSLASTPYREAIGSRLVSLRDFLLVFFFIDLGAQLDLSDAGTQLGQALVLSVFVLVGKPLMVLAVMRLRGYRIRTGFHAGLALGQISEFSLIVAGLALTLGHVGPDTISLITAVAVITIGASTYLVRYSHELYRRIAPLLAGFDQPPAVDGTSAGEQGADVVVVGAGRFGSHLLEDLLELNLRVLVVDQDPQALRMAGDRGAGTLFGDAEEPELAAAMATRGPSWVVSTVPDRAVNLALLHGLTHAAYRGRFAATAHHDHDEEELQQAGADIVLRPFHDAAHRSLSLLLSGLDEAETAPAGPT